MRKQHEPGWAYSTVKAHQEQVLLWDTFLMLACVPLAWFVTMFAVLYDAVVDHYVEDYQRRTEQ